jgi:hypothetical protein
MIERDISTVTERERARRARARSAPPTIVVTPFLDWCALRGISAATGRRLVAAGKLRVVRLSKRRLGVRSDDDEMYLAACSSQG